MPTFFQRAKRWLLRFNIFNSGTLDQQELRIELWSSWIFILGFIAVLGTLSVYTGLRRQTTSITVGNPSYSTFESLQKTYANTLQCPCSNTAVKYSSYTQIHSTFHQVCSSSFITDEWIVATFKANTSYVWPMDARTLASSHAQGLRFLCETSKAGVNSRITIVLTAATYTPEAIPAAIVELYVKSLVEEIPYAASTQSATLLELLSYAASGEMFISGLGTNAVAYMAPEVPAMPSLAANAYRMVDGSMCYCLPARSCPAPAAIYSSRASQTRTVLSIDTNSTLIRGMRTDCYPYNSLILSTLECYYDLSCIQLLVSNISSFKPLNATLPSKYAISDTVGQLIGPSMAEDFSYTYSAEEHYAQCAPRTCVYSYVQGSPMLAVITTIVGVVGGLNTALLFFVPLLIHALFTVKKKLFPSARGGEFMVVTPVQNSVLTNKQKILSFLAKIRDLNLFQTKLDDPAVADRERQMTRLYIVLLLLTFTTLAFYVGFSEVSNVHTVTNPSESDYLSLHAKYSNVLQCPCSRPQISYSNITTVDLKFHQVCSSGFITPLFIAQLFTFNDIYTHKHDFMAMSAIHFTHITLLCVLTKKSILDSYGISLRGNLTTSKLLPPDVFEKKINSDLTSFGALAKAYLNRGISELLELTTASFVLSAGYTSFNLRILSDGSIQIEPSGFSNCSCITNAKTCSTDAAFYDYNLTSGSLTLLSKVMGMRLACSPFRSTMQSTFACWYSSECYQQVVSFWQNRTTMFPFVPSPLDRTVDIHFNASDTISDIVKGALLDQVTVHTSYSSFFSTCAASSCSYSTTGRQNLILIVTSLISISSGLSVALRLVTPFIIHLAYWFRGHVQGHIDVFHLIRGFPRRLIHLNFFFNRRTSSNWTLQSERRTTRLYIVSWFAGFILLLLYNSLTEETITRSVSQPTERIYTDLFAVYSATLQCPCTTILFLNTDFVRLSAQLHQVCSSAFIEDPWIQSIFGDGNWTDLAIDQFRSRGAVYFIVQQSFCGMGQRVIESIRREFERGEVFRGRVIPEEQLISQMKVTVDSTIKWNQNDFVSMLRGARGGIQINHLINLFSTNWIFSPQANRNIPYYRIPTSPVSYKSNCSCSISTGCTEPVYIGDTIVPGFVVGCFPMESLLRSTLSCLYNQTCLQLINIGNLPSIRPLDRSLPTRYSINSTVEDLSSGAFMEDWSLNISYSTFFSTCNPAICTYSISQKKDTLQVTTILLGLYGGLTLILRFLAPRLMAGLQLISVWMRRSNAAVVPFA